MRDGMGQNSLLQKIPEGAASPTPRESHRLREKKRNEVELLCGRKHSDIPPPYRIWSAPSRLSSCSRRARLCEKSFMSCYASTVASPQASNTSKVVILPAPPIKSRENQFDCYEKRNERIIFPVNQAGLNQLLTYPKECLLPTCTKMFSILSPMCHV